MQEAMSKTKQVLELSSPSVKSVEERMTGVAQQCNYCCGNGWFWGRDDLGESIKDPCPLCMGSGSVEAEITIRWRPVSRVIQPRQNRGLR